MATLRKIHLLLILFLTISIVSAQDKPAPASPPAVAKGIINGANIIINYGSPSVKGRTIWGELVPFNKVWRAGANDATTFETDKDLTVEGSILPAGKYSFFVIPNENECVIIFNKVAKQWGAYKYKESDDQLRVTVKQKVVDSSTENLVYKINKNNIVLIWEKWKIPISIK